MILICTPTWVPLPPTPGSVQQEAACGHIVWVSVSGVLEMLRRPDLRAMCFECIPRGPQPIYESPLVRQELAGLIGKEEADRVMRMARRAYGQ